MTFTPEVYAEIREGARRSAAVIVPLLVEAVLTRSVLDVGCGEGWFAREFALRYPSMVITAVDQTVEARKETEGLTFLPFDLVTDELRDFTDGIHRCQYLLAMRVVRRVYPVGWPNKGET